MTKDGAGEPTNKYAEPMKWEDEELEKAFDEEPCPEVTLAPNERLFMNEFPQYKDLGPTILYFSNPDDSIFNQVSYNVQYVTVTMENTVANTANSSGDRLVPQNLPNQFENEQKLMTKNRCSRPSCGGKKCPGVTCGYESMQKKVSPPSSIPDDKAEVRSENATDQASQRKTETVKSVVIIEPQEEVELSPERYQVQGAEDACENAQCKKELCPGKADCEYTKQIQQTYSKSTAGDSSQMQNKCEDPECTELICPGVTCTEEIRIDSQPSQDTIVISSTFQSEENKQPPLCGNPSCTFEQCPGETCLVGEDNMHSQSRKNQTIPSAVQSLEAANIQCDNPTCDAMQILKQKAETPNVTPQPSEVSSKPVNAGDGPLVAEVCADPTCDRVDCKGKICPGHTETEITVGEGCQIPTCDRKDTCPGEECQGAVPDFDQPHVPAIPSEQVTAQSAAPVQGDCQDPTCDKTYCPGQECVGYAANSSMPQAPAVPSEGGNVKKVEDLASPQSPQFPTPTEISETEPSDMHDRINKLHEQLKSLMAEQDETEKRCFEQRQELRAKMEALEANMQKGAPPARTDLESLTILQKLVSNKLETKKRILQLERQEMAYIQVLKNTGELIDQLKVIPSGDTGPCLPSDDQGIPKSAKTAESSIEDRILCLEKECAQLREELDCVKQRIDEIKIAADVQSLGIDTKSKGDSVKATESADESTKIDSKSQIEPQSTGLGDTESCVCTDQEEDNVIAADVQSVEIDTKSKGDSVKATQSADESAKKSEIDSKSQIEPESTGVGDTESCVCTDQEDNVVCPCEEDQSVDIEQVPGTKEKLPEVSAVSSNLTEENVMKETETSNLESTVPTKVESVPTPKEEQNAIVSSDRCICSGNTDGKDLQVIDGKLVCPCGDEVQNIEENIIIPPAEQVPLKGVEEKASEKSCICLNTTEGMNAETEAKLSCHCSKDEEANIVETQSKAVSFVESQVKHHGSMQTFPGSRSCVNSLDAINDLLNAVKDLNVALQHVMECEECADDTMGKTELLLSIIFDITTSIEQRGHVTAGNEAASPSKPFANDDEIKNVAPNEAKPEPTPEPCLCAEAETNGGCPTMCVCSDDLDNLKSKLQNSQQTQSVVQFLYSIMTEKGTPFKNLGTDFEKQKKDFALKILREGHWQWLLQKNSKELLNMKDNSPVTLLKMDSFEDFKHSSRRSQNYQNLIELDQAKPEKSEGSNEHNSNKMNKYNSKIEGKIVQETGKSAMIPQGTQNDCGKSFQNSFQVESSDNRLKEMDFIKSGRKPITDLYESKFSLTERSIPTESLSDYSKILHPNLTESSSYEKCSEIPEEKEYLDSNFFSHHGRSSLKGKIAKLNEDSSTSFVTGSLDNSDNTEDSIPCGSSNDDSQDLDTDFDEFCKLKSQLKNINDNQRTDIISAAVDVSLSQKTSISTKRFNKNNMKQKRGLENSEVTTLYNSNTPSNTFKEHSSENSWEYHNSNTNPINFQSEKTGMKNESNLTTLFDSKKNYEFDYSNLEENTENADIFKNVANTFYVPKLGDRNKSNKFNCLGNIEEYNFQTNERNPCTTDEENNFYNDKHFILPQGWSKERVKLINEDRIRKTNLEYNVKQFLLNNPAHVFPYVITNNVDFSKENVLNNYEKDSTTASNPLDKSNLLIQPIENNHYVCGQNAETFPKYDHFHVNEKLLNLHNTLNGVAVNLPKAESLIRNMSQNNLPSQENSTTYSKNINDYANTNSENKKTTNKHENHQSACSHIFRTTKVEDCETDSTLITSKLNCFAQYFRDKQILQSKLQPTETQESVKNFDDTEILHLNAVEQAHIDANIFYKKAAEDAIISKNDKPYLTERTSTDDQNIKLRSYLQSLQIESHSDYIQNLSHLNQRSASDLRKDFKGISLQFSEVPQILCEQEEIKHQLEKKSRHALEELKVHYPSQITSRKRNSSKLAINFMDEFPFVQEHNISTFEWSNIHNESSISKPHDGMLDLDSDLRSLDVTQALENVITSVEILKDKLGPDFVIQEVSNCCDSNAIKYNHSSIDQHMHNVQLSNAIQSSNHMHDMTHTFNLLNIKQYCTPSIEEGLETTQISTQLSNSEQAQNIKNSSFNIQNNTENVHSEIIDKVIDYATDKVEGVLGKVSRDSNNQENISKSVINHNITCVVRTLLKEVFSEMQLLSKEELDLNSVKEIISRHNKLINTVKNSNSVSNETEANNDANSKPPNCIDREIEETCDKRDIENIYHVFQANMLDFKDCLKRKEMSDQANIKSAKQVEKIKTNTAESMKHFQKENNELDRYMMNFHESFIENIESNIYTSATYVDNPANSTYDQRIKSEFSAECKASFSQVRILIEDIINQVTNQPTKHQPNNQSSIFQIGVNELIQKQNFEFIQQYMDDKFEKLITFYDIKKVRNHPPEQSECYMFDTQLTEMSNNKSNNLNSIPKVMSDLLEQVHDKLSNNAVNNNNLRIKTSDENIRQLKVTSFIKEETNSFNLSNTSKDLRNRIIERSNDSKITRTVGILSEEQDDKYTIKVCNRSDDATEVIFEHNSKSVMELKTSDSQLDIQENYNVRQMQEDDQIESDHDLTDKFQSSLMQYKESQRSLMEKKKWCRNVTSKENIYLQGEKLTKEIISEKCDNKLKGNIESKFSSQDNFYSASEVVGNAGNRPAKTCSPQGKKVESQTSFYDASSNVKIFSKKAVPTMPYSSDPKLSAEAISQGKSIPEVSPVMPAWFIETMNEFTRGERTRKPIYLMAANEIFSSDSLQKSCSLGDIFLESDISCDFNSAPQEAKCLDEDSSDESSCCMLDWSKNKLHGCPV